MEVSQKVYISFICCILGSAPIACSDLSDMLKNLEQQLKKDISTSPSGTYIQQSPGISSQKTTTIQTTEKTGGQQPPERTEIKTSTEKVQLFDPKVQIFNSNISE